MPFQEVVLTVSQKDAETVAALCTMAVPYGFYEEDYSDLKTQAVEIAHIDLIDEQLLQKDRSIVRFHLYFDEDKPISECLLYLSEQMRQNGISYETEENQVDDIDWNEYWKSFFHTVPIGKRLVIVPKWEKYDGDRKVLKIDPGAAFGTGTHATTSLCLSLLEEYVTDSCRVLDIGCGSGILAIAGVLLGAKSALGVDIDETSVRVAGENAAMNAVSDSCCFVCGDLTEKVDGEYDIICANLVADVILRLLTDVRRYMKKGCVLLLSGILDIREKEVVEAVQRAGLRLLRNEKQENWVALAVTN